MADAIEGTEAERSTPARGTVDWYKEALHKETALIDLKTEVIGARAMIGRALEVFDAGGDGPVILFAIAHAIDRMLVTTKEGLRDG